jgi:hypothetical protein
LLKNKQTGKYCRPVNTNGYNNISCTSDTKIPLRITQFDKSQVPTTVSCNINNCNNALRNAYANNKSATPAYSNINECMNCPAVPSGQLIPQPAPPAPPAPETPASYPIPYSKFALRASESGPYCYLASSSAIQCDSQIPSQFNSKNQRIGSEISANDKYCYDNTFNVSCDQNNHNFNFFVKKDSETNPNIVSIKNTNTNKYCGPVMDNGYNLFKCTSENDIPLYLSEYTPPTSSVAQCNKVTCNNALRNAYANGQAVTSLYANANECLGCPSVPTWQLIP